MNAANQAKLPWRRQRFSGLLKGVLTGKETFSVGDEVVSSKTNPFIISA